MMTDTSTPETEPQPVAETGPPDDEALKERLLKRVVVAAVVVAGLLGSLVIFDTIRTPAVSVPDKIATLPPAAVVTPAPLAEPGDAARVPAEAGSGPGPQVENTVPERSAAPDSLTVQPLPGEKPLTKLATGRLAMLHPAPPAPAAAPPVEPARELARSHPEASRPLPQLTERQFGLQLGVFSNLANAEDLRARLEKNGIPATIEARVRAGPFATRAEAEIARAKLKELGIDDGLLITMKGKTPS